jgi:hypothetical protein
MSVMFPMLHAHVDWALEMDYDVGLSWLSTMMGMLFGIKDDHIAVT